MTKEQWAKVLARIHEDTPVTEGDLDSPISQPAAHKAVQVELRFMSDEDWLSDKGREWLVKALDSAAGVYPEKSFNRFYWSCDVESQRDPESFPARKERSAWFESVSGWMTKHMKTEGHRRAKYNVWYSRYHDDIADAWITVFTALEKG